VGVAETQTPGKAAEIVPALCPERGVEARGSSVKKGFSWGKWEPKTPALPLLKLLAIESLGQ
jgi:hypothetical protein